MTCFAASFARELGDLRRHAVGRDWRQPARYPHRDAIAANAGQAPVAVESGKRKNARFRWACNKRLRNALGILAHGTRRWNPWAADRYAKPENADTTTARCDSRSCVEPDHLALLADPHPV